MTREGNFDYVNNIVHIGGNEYLLITYFGNGYKLTWNGKDNYKVEKVITSINSPQSPILTTYTGTAELNDDGNLLGITVQNGVTQQVWIYDTSHPDCVVTVLDIQTLAHKDIGHIHDQKKVFVDFQTYKEKTKGKDDIGEVGNEYLLIQAAGGAQ